MIKESSLIFYSLIIGLFVNINIYPTLLAQTEKDVKLSGNYHWGQAEAPTADEAKKLALNDLIFKIQVTVSSEFTNIQSEYGDEINEETVSELRTSSRMTLKGVDFIVENKSGSYSVLAFISKDNYKRSIDAAAEEIRQIVKMGEKQENQLGMASAIDSYYRAFLKSFLSPEPVSYQSINDAGSITNIIPFLRSKIETFLSGMDIRPGTITVDKQATMITIPVNVSCNYKPVSGIQLGFNAEELLTVSDGKVTLFKYAFPTNTVEEYDLVAQMHLENTPVNADLINLQNAFKISKSKKIKIDFSQYIKINFSITPQASGSLLFEPVHSGIGITSFEWDFGDGFVSSEESPLHQYNQNGNYTVRLTLNNIPQLKVEKNISSDGKIVGNVPDNPNPVPPGPDNSSIHPIISELKLITDYQALGKQLYYYKNQQKLMYGKQSSFVNPQNCYIFIVNPESKQVIALLSQGSSQRKDLISGQTVTSISNQYKGMLPIYVEVY